MQAPARRIAQPLKQSRLMSLLADIQKLTERTYQPTGVNFEKFIINRERYLHLSRFDFTSGELPDWARVFFRVRDQRLHVGIYYSRELIRALEAHDPRAGLSERNIAAFGVFVEEINHAVHGALKFLEGLPDFGQESFLQDLELQAKIDTYLVLKYFLACFNKSKQLEAMDRLWLRHHLFERGSASYTSARLSQRYAQAIVLGDKYSRFLDSLPVSERLEEIRRFRRLPYHLKQHYINCLP
jgi:hypothetical protein